MVLITFNGSVSLIISLSLLQRLLGHLQGPVNERSIGPLQGSVYQRSIGHLKWSVYQRSLTGVSLSLFRAEVYCSSDLRCSLSISCGDLVAISQTPWNHSRGHNAENNETETSKLHHKIQTWVPSAKNNTIKASYHIVTHFIEWKIHNEIYVAPLIIII